MILLKLLGTIVNCGTVVLGCSVGLILKKGIPQKLEKIIMQAIALSVLAIGVMGIFDSQNTLVLIISMVLGTVIGSLIDIDKWINKLAEKLGNKFSKKDNISEGFVSSTLLFCVGAMSVVGSLKSGLKLDHSTLYSKSLLDLVSSMILASSYGFGVYFSIFSLILYQGGITLIASVLEPLLTQTIISEMSAVGSLLILALSLNMLKITDIKIMNMLPAVFIPILIYQLPIF